MRRGLAGCRIAKGVESTYCSQACVEQGRLGRGGLYASTRVRDQVFGLEGGVCRKCGIDAHSLFLRISALEPPERLNALINAKWHLPKTGGRWIVTSTAKGRRGFFGKPITLKPWQKAVAVGFGESSNALHPMSSCRD